MSDIDNERIINISMENARTDHRAWLTPIWEGNTVYCETGMFVGRDDRISLLFKPKSILRVTSYDGLTVYEEGADFILSDDGEIALTDGSSIPVISIEEYYHDDPSSILKTLRDGKEIFTYCGENKVMTRWQICVTYAHEGAESAFVPPCRSDRYTSLISKLERGEDVTVLFFGDSITYGCSSSMLGGYPPYMPAWPQLTVDHLAERYGYTVRYIKSGLDREVLVPDEDSVFGNRGMITYVNTAVGGWRTQHGIDNFKERVGDIIEKYGCDLFVLAFGMNDGKLTGEELIGKQRMILDGVVSLRNDVSMLLVSTMIPNPEASNGWYRNQHTYEPYLTALADEYNSRGIPCATAPVTSMSKFVTSRKRFRDHSGNNINHPNDFMIRLYAQTVIETLVGHL